MNKWAYYNENDPFAAAWLRNLMRAGHIMDGAVDNRSIEDVAPGDLQGFARHHFFAGIGGWDFALRLAGWPSDRPIWTGSCPCQPFSAAGRRRGTEDQRHLWPAWFHLINAVRPPVIVGEQVASKQALGWLDTVFFNLEGADYACWAADLSAASVGSPQIRQRLYWMAGANGAGLEVEREQPAWGERPSAQRGGQASGLAGADGAGPQGNSRGRLLRVQPAKNSPYSGLGGADTSDTTSETREATHRERASNAVFRSPNYTAVGRARFLAYSVVVRRIYGWRQVDDSKGVAVWDDHNTGELVITTFPPQAAKSKP